MSTEHVNIPERQAEFIRGLIDTGKYGDIHEVIRASVLLLEERIAHEEKQKDKLRKMMDEAFAGGVVDDTFEEIWDKAATRYKERNA